MNRPDPERIEAAYFVVRDRLLAERNAAGHWAGQLSTSALSTATAVSALSLVRDSDRTTEHWEPIIAKAIDWLAAHVNSDGGWGDTDRSYSNISTTMLVRSAFHLAGVASQHADLLTNAERYIEAQGGVAGLRRRYGRDKTFAVPILTNGALAGLVPWKDVSALPFEAACVPQRFYRFIRLPVVSYAIPALVAIGQARFLHRPSVWPWMRWLRRVAIRPSLRVLEKMQPASGGYLEAAPLTSFVVMSLAGTGRADHPVAHAGVRFLLDSVRPDGSLPIDTNLATWVTTLSINALAKGGEDVAQLECLDWLLSCQHRVRHPFTGADPGGWGWTDLSGAVPDSDDTPGALLALAAWSAASSCQPEDRLRIEEAADAGLRWLLGLQNRDGGWPTFCRGWGKLPFDRSGADLTAHALRALHHWQSRPVALTASRAVERAFHYLQRQQRHDGSWVPLWFGNQDDAEEENPIYGTSKVLLAYRDWKRLNDASAQRAFQWLEQMQNEDGGWGGGANGSSVEETALAVEAMLAAPHSEQFQPAIDHGLSWLVDAVELNRYGEASPIGFYFAKLWYYERHYPLVFTLAALAAARS